MKKTHLFQCFVRLVLSKLIWHWSKFSYTSYRLSNIRPYKRRKSYVIMKIFFVAIKRWRAHLKFLLILVHSYQLYFVLFFQTEFTNQFLWFGMIRLQMDKLRGWNVIWQHIKLTWLATKALENALIWNEIEQSLSFLYPYLWSGTPRDKAPKSYEVSLQLKILTFKL